MSILVGATPEVSTLSLHDALPICVPRERAAPINVCLRELLEAAANLLIEHLVPLIHVNLEEALAACCSHSRAKHIACVGHQSRRCDAAPLRCLVCVQSAIVQLGGSSLPSGEAMALRWPSRVE